MKRRPEKTWIYVVVAYDDDGDVVGVGTSTAPAQRDGMLSAMKKLDTACRVVVRTIWPRTMSVGSEGAWERDEKRWNKVA